MTVSIPASVRKNAVPAIVDATHALNPYMKRHPRYARAVEIFMMTQAAYAAYTKIRARFAKEEEHWTVSVRESDDLYETAVALMSSQDTKNWKAVSASAVYTGDDTREVDAMPTDREERHLTINGHKVFAFIDGMVSAGAPAQAGRILKSPTIIFVADSEAGQRAVLDVLTANYAADSREVKIKKPMLYSWGGWGWSRRTELPNRPVESVAVTDNQVQEIVDDLKKFLASEEEYTRRGIPFHRGYLLYGPPGTGKTSAVKAIAHAVGRNLYYASLSGLNGDNDINQIAEGIDSGNMLLLEDIDSFGAARQRDEEHADDGAVGSGVTTTGLLNVLDGINTPHGMITFMTTNHKEFLDAALLRPGRVDKHVFFSNPDNATVERHFEFFFGRKPSVPLRAGGRSGADVNEIFISNMHDPEGAERVLSADNTEA